MLEQKIEALTQAVEQLSKLIVDIAAAYDSHQDTKPTTVVEQKQEPKKAAPEPEPKAPTTTAKQEPTQAELTPSALPDREELKTKCAELVRKDTSNKDKIFTELAKYKAKKVLDLKDTELQAFADYLKSLEA